jgi:prephenate dehydrogenase
MKGVRIIGSGLIGTSIALALSSRGIAVEMTDSDSGRASLANDLVNSIQADQVDLVILALPTSQVGSVINAEFSINPQAIFMDVGSVMTKPLVEIESSGPVARRFCSSHPMAGREIGGPESARSDLFVGRPWIYTPTSVTDDDVLPVVLELIRALGAIPIRMGAAEHDAAVALLSHLPQISASLLAMQLRGGDEAWFALSGQGVKDATRIAASDPKLWREIISMNREKIQPLLIQMRQDLSQLIDGFDNDEVIEDFIAQGRLGRRRIPGKHGGQPRDYAYLPVVIEDKPGKLAALFQECADAQVNVEDLSIEHSPGQFTGLVTLALSPTDVERLGSHLLQRGWNVHSSR